MHLLRRSSVNKGAQSLCTEQLLEREKERQRLIIQGLLHIFSHFQTHLCWQPLVH